MSANPPPSNLPEDPVRLSAADSPSVGAVALSESPAPGVISLEIPPARGYWLLTWQQFRKRRDAYVALYVLALLFLIALAAPLLANRLPWYFHSAAGTSFPLIREFISPLSQLDRFYNCMLMALIVLAGFFGIAKFEKADVPARLSGTWYRPALGIFAVLFVVSLLIGGKNDETDYRDLAAQPGNTALFTVVPWGSLELDTAANSNAPDRRHLLGCDTDGHDVLARVIHGSRISLAVGFLATGLAVAIGIVFGSLSGYFGGWVDVIAQRIIEIFICFPSFFLILTIIAIVPQRSIFWVMFAIGLTGWMGIARLIRGEVLKVRQLEYVSAAKALGVSDTRIIFRHIMPNALAPVLVAATFSVAGAILSETGLGFLGLGVEPPTPSWGELLNQARQDPVRLWWLMLYPGFMIFLSVTLMNLVGEGMRDAMDPKLRK
jgi:peptide/nickel transport system permease protein